MAAGEERSARERREESDGGGVISVGWLDGEAGWSKRDATSESEQQRGRQGGTREGKRDTRARVVGVAGAGLDSDHDSEARISEERARGRMGHSS